MSRLAASNPITCFLSRQIDDKKNHKKQLINARFEAAENFYRKDLYSHFGCVNAIEFSKNGDLFISGGDDRRILLWNVEKAVQGNEKPVSMKAQHQSNIFCLGYNSSVSKIFSAGNDDQVIVHDLKTTDIVNLFLHEKPVYGLSAHPHNDHVFASACDDGRILIYDIRGSCTSAESFFCLAQYKTPFHSVMFNPVEPLMLATANTKEGVSTWDIRKPLKPVIRYGSEGPAQSCMNVRFNSAGTTLLALRRRLPPALYPINSPEHICKFDHPGYYNSCTMKSCFFAGNDDEYILSGSDDFNLYMWKIPDDDQVKWVDTAHMILKGHRSIVNQVRYNPTSCIIASSGVEKIIKLWSPFPFNHKCQGSLKKEEGKPEKQRRVFTHDEYIGLVLRSGQFMTHDYSQQSTVEDPRMMAFFDSLVQREIEGWSSEDVTSTPHSPTDNDNSIDSSVQSVDTDSEDSTSPDLMLSILEASVTQPETIETTERSSDSPNRITRLIANRREKLMRLAAQENGVTVEKNSIMNNSSNNIESNVSSDLENSQINNNKQKFSSKKSKLASRNHKRSLGKKNKILKNQVNFSKKGNSDSDSDEVSIDSTQPSTSTGVISRRSRYATHSLTNNNKKRSSSGSSEENFIMYNKRKHNKHDSNTSDSTTNDDLENIDSIKMKTENGFNNKRKKLKNNLSEQKEKNPVKSCMIQSVHNGAKKEMAMKTPKKNSSCKFLASDSGITSGISTNEKNSISSRKNDRNSSDSDKTSKSLIRFRKKVNVAKRGYRKRVLLPSSQSTSESSD